jgi:hypothetical protein
VRPTRARVPQARFFDHEQHTLGSARGSCQEEFLMPRMTAAGGAALARWTAAGGEGAAAITHLVVGGLTAPRAAPGTHPRTRPATKHAPTPAATPAPQNPFFATRTPLSTHPSPHRRPTGPDVLLASALGLPRTVARTPLHHLGCLGGFRALAVAADIARSDPSARVLVVYGDVSSLIGASLQSPMNEADLLSIAIFTDGAAAAVVGGSGPARGAAAGAAGAPPLARLATARSGLIRAHDGAPTADQMWLRESGFRPDGSIIGENFVGKGVPKHLLRSLAPFVDALLADYEAAAARASGSGSGSGSGSSDGASEGERFAPPLASLPVLCHPGGPAVLDTVTRALRLAPWQLTHSWAVLSARGNMSGATNLFVLHDFLAGGAHLPDGSRATHAMGLAFGPGLAVEGLLLEIL